MLEKQRLFIDQYNAESDSVEKLNIIIAWADSQADQPGINMVKVEGCLSRVMYSLFVDVDGFIRFNGWSNSVLMAGVLQLCAYFYNGLPVEELTEDDFTWLDDIELLSSISKQRGAAISSVISQLKNLIPSEDETTDEEVDDNE